MSVFLALCSAAVVGTSDFFGGFEDLAGSGGGHGAPAYGGVRGLAV